MNQLFYETVRYLDNSHVYLQTADVVNISLHIHNELEILCVLNHSMRVLVKDTLYDLSEGDIMVINSYEPHRIITLSENCSHILLQFDPFRLFPNIEEWRHKTCQAYRVSIQENALLYQKFLERILNLQLAYQSKSELHHLAVVSHLGILYTFLTEQFPWENSYPEEEPSYDNILLFRRVLSYLCANLDQPISLTDAARESNLSSYHFCRFFKRMSGKTFVQYLTEMRLRNAEMLLATTENKISEIAEQCGFRSIKTFNHTFRKQYDLSPREYRSKQRERNSSKP